MQIKLKQRLLAAIIMVPLTVSAVLSLESEYLAIIFIMIACMAAYEWAAMSYEKTARKIMYVSVCALLMVLVGLYLQSEQVKFFMFLASIYWVCILMLLSFYESTWIDNYLLNSFLSASGYFVITVGWLSMIHLHQQDPALLLYMFILIWIADSGAYFSGKQFGKTKLAEQLSPGKTREGLLGAMVLSTLFALVAVWWFEFKFLNALYFVLLSLLSVLVSVVGDLFESLIKRNAGKKDSGSIIPGHGGILDRIDSLLAAAPGFALGVHWLH